jgi:hypothetical protein
MNTARLLPLVSALLLSGCSSQTSVWNQYFQVLRESYRNTTGRGVVTMQQAAAIPYATLAYRADGGNEMLLVLATDTQGDLLWTAASRVVLLTRDGRILQSVGLPHNRGGMAAAASGSALPPPAQALQGAYRSTRLVDFPDAGLHGVQLNCITTAQRAELVTILGTALATRRVDERCESRTPRWSFTDSYWVDPNGGFVWQSLQHLHPSGPVMRVKILRPPE